MFKHRNLFVKSKLKDFIKVAAWCLVVVSFILVVLPRIWWSSNTYAEGNYLKRLETTEVVIKPGDTIWSLQQSLTPDEDIRDLLTAIKKINNIKSWGSIKPNQKVILFKNIED